MAVTRVRYNRVRAVRYALRYWRTPNPAYANLDTTGSGGDCTNFTSQALRAGGMPLDYRRTGYDTEWWYRRRGRDRYDSALDDWWSCTWTLADSQYRYWQANGGEELDVTNNRVRARRLRRGDVLYYDWDGDGRFTHSAIVTAHTRAGTPLVTYRTLRPRQPVRNRDYRLRFRGRAAKIIGMRLPSRPFAHANVPNWDVLHPCDRNR